LRLGHLISINDVALSPDGTTLATAGVGEVKFWDVATGGPRHARIPRSSWRIAISPDGRTLAVLATAADVELWNVQSGQLVKTMTDPGGSERGGVTRLQFSPDGGTIVLESDSRTAVFDAASALLKQALPVGSLAFSGDSRTLAYTNPRAVLIDVESGSRRWGLPEAQPPFAFAPNGKVLWTAGSGLIKAWRVDDGRLLVSRRVLPRQEDSTRDWLAFTPDGYFDGTPDSERYLIWRDGERFSLPPVYRDRFHSVDRVREALEAGR
jgi:WD40 repeat protein